MLQHPSKQKFRCCTLLSDVLNKIRFTSKHFWKIHCVGHTQVVWDQAPQMKEKPQKRRVEPCPRLGHKLCTFWRAPTPVYLKRFMSITRNLWKKSTNWILVTRKAEFFPIENIDRRYFIKCSIYVKTAFISTSFFTFSLQPQIWPICLTGMTEFPTTVPRDHAIELHVLFVVNNSSPILFTLIFSTNITSSVRFHVTYFVRKVVWNLSVLLFNKWQKIWWQRDSKSNVSNYCFSPLNPPGTEN